MKGMSVVLGAAARLYAPLIAMFAAILLMTRAPGAGVGVSAGVALALALALHALVFGIDAARVALPPLMTRLIAAVGLLFVVAGAGMPRMPYAPQLMEAGLFAVTAAGLGLCLLLLIGRAPTLRDEELG